MALQLHLSLIITSYSGEHSFSLLTRVKNVPQSTTTQEHLSALSLLSIKNEIGSLNWDDSIHYFATAKVGEKMFV